ncbi:putative flavin-containing monooxygenase 2 [Eucalyptus grandis]|uniref:putative flavin-containing monooxygenase 2 n=1 Tax=Eucalyptus grandis TaxID=71139 RepID=UPI00192ECEFA|nr:putative flavin-containing monooxygenase 2 [Eucalyptus grandis]
MERRVVIIGAGISGLLACKYAVEKGFDPVVFEAEDRIGGVWNHTIQSTKLQNAKDGFRFSDFDWPASVQEIFPSHTEVLDYVESYAQHFNLYPYIKFHSRVINIDFVGESFEEMKTWDLWGGTGMAFGSKGKWHITVLDTKTNATERWGISKFSEIYLQWKLPLKKYGVVPRHSFLEDLSSCQIGMLPDNFYDKVEEGSILVKRSQSFRFCKEGLIVGGEDKPISSDLVILATGYKGDQKLKNIFRSSVFQKYLVPSPTSTIPLYSFFSPSTLFFLVNPGCNLVPSSRLYAPLRSVSEPALFLLSSSMVFKVFNLIL